MEGKRIGHATVYIFYRGKFHPLFKSFRSVKICKYTVNGCKSNVSHLVINQIMLFLAPGSQVGKYGPTKTSSLAQPTSIAVLGKSIIVCDTAQSSVLMCSPTQGLVKFYKNLGKMLNAFNIHTHTTKYTLPQAITLMKSVR